ncbi:MAG: hypothetical protein KKC03_13210 [Bacteroidetes bacterium]|nr:hypothetical protein [Bacteroidota bacterium]
MVTKGSDGKFVKAGLAQIDGCAQARESKAARLGVAIFRFGLVPLKLKAVLDEVAGAKAEVEKSASGCSAEQTLQAALHDGSGHVRVIAHSLEVVVETLLDVLLDREDEKAKDEEARHCEHVEVPAAFTSALEYAVKSAMDLIQAVNRIRHGEGGPEITPMDAMSFNSVRSVLYDAPDALDVVNCVCEEAIDELRELLF